MATKLPSWMKMLPSGAVSVDPDIAYPIVFKALGVDEKAIDQYYVEVAYQCTKMATQDAINGSEHDPRPDKALVILIEAGDGRKDRWALKNFPVGRGVVAATKGREARGFYGRVMRPLMLA